MYTIIIDWSIYRNVFQWIIDMIVFAHSKLYDLSVKISCASTGLFIWIRWRMNKFSKYDHASASKNHHFPYMLRFHLLEFIFFTSNISSQQGWILIMVSSWQGINTFKVRPSFYLIQIKYNTPLMYSISYFTIHLHKN